MKRKNLVRKKQLYSTEIEALCSACSVVNELFNFSEDLEKQNHLRSMVDDLSDLLRELTENNNQYVEKIPLKKGEN